MGALLNSSLLHRLHRATQIAGDRFAKELRDKDLTIRQIVVLSAIAANQSASQTAIVEVTGVDRSTLADIVKRLMMRGYLSRRRSKLDARAYAVELTDEGRRTLQAALPVLQRVEADLLASLPARKREELADLLDGLINRNARDAYRP